MKRALEDVGHQNLDGPAVKRALESMKDFDVNGMAKFTFGPKDRTGVQEYALYQMQNEKIIGLSDWQQAPILAPYKMCNTAQQRCFILVSRGGDMSFQDKLV